MEVTYALHFVSAQIQDAQIEYPAISTLLILFRLAFGSLSSAKNIEAATNKPDSNN